MPCLAAAHRCRRSHRKPCTHTQLPRPFPSPRTHPSTPSSALESFFPKKSAAHFLTKVALNQLLLAPVVISVVFAWNLALQGQATELPAKLRRDFLPSLINGGWGGLEGSGSRGGVGHVV